MLLESGYLPSIEILLAAKLVWVRPYHRDWQNSLRNPSVGRMLEFFRHREVGCVHVRSPAARKLFYSLA